MNASDGMDLLEGACHLTDTHAPFCICVQSVLDRLLADAYKEGSEDMAKEILSLPMPERGKANPAPTLDSRPVFSRSSRSR